VAAKNREKKRQKKTIGRNASLSLLQAYNILFARFGPQHWWPGDTPFEIMVGAVLTQNTAWTNVEKAIANLQHARALDAAVIVSASHEQLARWLTPSGYFNIKAKRLKNFCAWYLEQGGYEALRSWPTARLRAGLLSVNGVGRETADDMLLYAFNRPVFVIDAYTRRIFSRLGLVDHDASYEALRRYFEETLRAGAGAGRQRLIRLFNEYHALIVVLGKDVCRKRPRCGACPLAAQCTYPLES